jgi:peptidoglycan/LPS O-acetylase OafA/YrhL
VTDATPKPKILYVETLRGLACFLLVAFHVIGNDPAHGLHLPDDHPLHIVNDVFADLRMPLFSFISGFVFVSIASSVGELGGRIRSKARRLLIPMLAVGSLHWIVQAATVGNVPPYWELFVLPYEQFWYLQATFVMMVALLTLTYLTGDRILVAQILIMVGAAIFIGFDRWRPEVFSSYRAFYLAPFFLSGFMLAMRRVVQERLVRPPRALWVGVLAALVALEGFTLVGPVDVVGPSDRLVSVFVGLTACYALFALRPESRALAFIGNHSYAIFLFHVFFTAGTRIALTKTLPGISEYTLFTVGVANGVMGPIALAALIDRNWVAKWALLGIAPRRGARQARVVSIAQGRAR